VRVAKSLHSEPYKLLLDMLIEARTRAGLTQAELARRLGRPQPFISFVERGERRVDVIEFYAIMRALGHDPEQAFRELAASLPDKLKI
jgi:transcriptional regulator with XRE-family HTH domain